MLEISHVKKHFGKQEVLKDVTLKVNKGDVIVILGPSGSGKTTFLRSLTFLEKADAGVMVFGDKQLDLHKAKQKDIAWVRKHTAFVFQNYNLFANKTALQNVMLGLTVGRGIPKEEAEAIARKALKEVGLADRADYYPSQLSGGQKQRCACARALINEPKLILADEPTGALDSKASRLLLETMSEINKKMQATILMVTHDPFSASFCERILFLKDGKIFNEIFRGEKSRKDFFNEILDILTLLGGEVGNVR